MLQLIQECGPVTLGNLGLYLWPWSKDTVVSGHYPRGQVTDTRLPAEFLSWPHSASKPVSSVGRLTSRTMWHLASDCCLRWGGLFSEGIESLTEAQVSSCIHSTSIPWAPGSVPGSLPGAEEKWIKQSIWWQGTRIKLSPLLKYSSKYN